MIDKYAPSNNVPIVESQNIPLGGLVQNSNSLVFPKRRYTKYRTIAKLAIEKYKGTGKGISFNDLILSGFARHKRQAQDTLKRFRQKKILFTLENHKPQQYYPFCLKSEVINARLSKNAPLEVTGAPLLQSTYPSTKDAIVTQTLEGYVLPLLHDVPLNIHKLHLMTRIPSEYYHEIALPSSRWNSAKEHQEIVGTAFVKYVFYANGTVMIFIESSNNPFKLENHTDLSRLIAFLGQTRDRLVLFLHDRHERIVSEIILWELKQCDINRDVKVSDWLQLTGLKIQVRHAFHLFRIYIRSKGRDTVCRVEESVVISDNNRSAVETINKVFNPTERFENQIAKLENKVNQVLEFFGSRDYEHWQGTHTCANIDSFDMKKEG